jgi:predicted dehydrogenase
VAAGVPVVVDKPLGTDATSARRLVEAAESAGVPLTVFQNRRWDAEQLTLLRLVADGELGEVLRFERRWERWRPVPKDRWRENASPEHGGGLLLDLHSHLVDSAVQLLGPVVTVYAEVAARTTPAEDDTRSPAWRISTPRTPAGRSRGRSARRSRGRRASTPTSTAPSAPP